MSAASLDLAGAAAGAMPAALAALGVPAGRPAAAADVLATLPVPGVAAVAGAATGPGGAVLALSPRGARLLAAATLGQDPAAVGTDAGAGLSELERSALAEALDQVLVAAGDAAGMPLGAPVTRELADAADAADAARLLPAAGCRAVTTELDVLGERAVLVVVVADAPADVPSSAPEPDARRGTGAVGGTVLDTKLRVWAEVGRARLPVGRVVSLPAGSLIELDRLAEDPVDIYVNGHRYATGRLVVDDGGGWAVRLEQVLGSQRPLAAA